MTRIVHLIPQDGIGGVEVAARSMAERDGLGHDFTLLLIAGPTLATNCSTVFASPFRSASNPLAQLRAVRLVLRIRPDVLVCSLWRSIPAALLVRLLRPRMKLAFFLHVDRAVHPLDALLTRAAIWAADEVWADSAATLAARKVAKPSRVISFVTTRLAVADRPGIEPLPQFVTWSRINRQKGIDRSIRLIESLIAHGVAASLDIWGPDGGELRCLEALVASLKLGERVQFRGILPHAALPAEASRARYFLQLSRFEGMAIGCVEAMQLGLVPVVTAVGEMAHYVIPGENGIVIDPDRLDDAAREVAALIADPPRFFAMRQRAIDRWRSAPLYADDVCAAAIELAHRDPVCVKEGGS